MSLAITGCKGGSSTDSIAKDYSKAKKDIQGLWINEEENDVVFFFRGDSIFFPKGGGEPQEFCITSDTLTIKTHHPIAYPIKHITGNTLKFVNESGDEITLRKSTDKEYLSLFHFGSSESPELEKDSLEINQNRRIKRDTILTVGENKLHVYVQVNPGHARVYKQTINEDGIRTEQVFSDNSIYVTIYNGAHCIYKHNFYKEHFKEHIPTDFLEQSILSDITIEKPTNEAMKFTAVIAMPDTYSSYNVILTITPDGKMSMAI